MRDRSHRAEKQEQITVGRSRRPAARRPNPRQQSDAARVVPEADRGHAGARRPFRRAEAIHPHRHELPVLRHGRVFVHGEAEEEVKALSGGEKGFSLRARCETPKLAVVGVVFGRFRRPQDNKFAVLLRDDLR